MTIAVLLRNRDFEALARIVRDRWSMDISIDSMECLHKLAFETDPPVAGGTEEQPWGNETWLLWLRNRLEDLSSQSCEHLLAKFNWSVSSPPESVQEWNDFLQVFNADLLASAEIRETLDDDIVSAGWLGFPPTTEAQLKALESRLEKNLPRSYRSFLLASDGWRSTGWDSIQILPCNKVVWLRDADPGIISAWCEEAATYEVPDDAYFVYGDAQDCCNIRNEYLPDMLLISGSSWTHQDYFFLNPRIVFDNGEWEAWHFSFEYPGASRYRSFAELMISEGREVRQMYQ